MDRNRKISQIIFDKIKYKQSQSFVALEPSSITLGYNDFEALRLEARYERICAIDEEWAVIHKRKKLIGIQQKFYGIKLNCANIPYLIRINFKLTESQKNTRQIAKLKKEISRQMGLPREYIKVPEINAKEFFNSYHNKLNDQLTYKIA